MNYALNNLATKVLKIIITSEAKSSCYSLLATKKSKINGRNETTYLNYC